MSDIKKIPIGIDNFEGLNIMNAGEKYLSHMDKSGKFYKRNFIWRNFHRKHCIVRDVFLAYSKLDVFSTIYC